MENLTKETFKQKIFDYEKGNEWKLENGLPCIIDFHADWCGPCKMVTPILEELSNEYNGKIDIFSVDTEQEQELAMAFGIKSIPSLLFCPKGGKPQMAQGALPKQAFVEIIDDLLIPNKS